MLTQKTKSISAMTIELLSEKLNAFYSVKSVFATQVFVRQYKHKQWYEALVYYREETQ